MTNQSHTELVAQIRAIAGFLAMSVNAQQDHPEEPPQYATEFDMQLEQAGHELSQIAAALESPERVQGEAIYQYQKANGSWIDQAKHSHEYNLGNGATNLRVLYTTQPTAPAQYSLPDELYESKDWKAANYAGRVEWLHVMYEAKKGELESFLSTATPSPQAEKQPLSEAQIVRCLQQASCIGTVKMSFESGPYDIDRPSINASRLVSAIEAAHGIVTKEST